ncbi:DNA/RNA non-specific endonuclease [Streptomyces yaizuensis]|uniref:DNA/RNA non-specific endonuclease/pyrophosphatase/phosphodiesterase domain-containing protein n=1 Tax=Streptomyces yaizuensis TaxID=2989713 RepID=A0ABQ5NRY4_9ACTN|nr:DNA/RNA non-specific endonuclease [Streptomyces sp. YSPA8]GLF93138.1 hypothetical protein SYYSPA8_02595 [Streptomyces sp. YSPA8]
MSPSDDSPAPAPDAAAARSLGDRQGYDEHFLGTPVPLPVPADPGVGTVVLPYTHFTVVHRPDRRLAAATGVCIDGSLPQEDVPRGDDWRLDPRLPGSAQAGKEIYANNRLDRGHLVRRLDPVWGGRGRPNRPTRTASTSPTPPRRWTSSTRARSCGRVWRTICSTTRRGSTGG